MPEPDTYDDDHPHPRGHLRVAARPCGNCPWRRDVPSGEFTAERYDVLSRTCGDGVQMGDPMFACHKTAEGKEIACAGWMATVGRDHPTVRLSVLTGRLDATALRPKPGWPVLFDTYEEMARTQGRGAEY